MDCRNKCGNDNESRWTLLERMKFWLNMQMAHDLWEAEQKVDVSGIPTLEVA